MVKAHKKFTYLADGRLDLDHWLAEIKQLYHLSDIVLFEKACLFAAEMTQGLTTFYGQSYLEQGLEIAQLVLHLQLDVEAAAAAVIASALTVKPIKEDVLRQQFNAQIARLSLGVASMDIFSALQEKKDPVHLNQVRRLLLAMAADIRVVVIKLAQQIVVMRGIKNINNEERRNLAQKVMDIYAPLANRLGMGQLKWELEDLAFRYIDPEEYKKISSFLAERRVDRENRITELIQFLKINLKETGIKADIQGRAKHIYSIYAKAQRKQLSYNAIFDYSAVRVLVPTIADCYTVLSIVHNHLQPIPEEFDDYVANPKANGYRSIHTAAQGPDGKVFEIQIRTQAMNDEAERGIAAHWLYKEKDASSESETEKITYLRQLLDWHREMGLSDATEAKKLAQIAWQQQVYVVTPAGDIIELPQGATPLDFAYHIHSELGHRCRGAKVNGHIVPLTYALQTGEKVEIITIPQGEPSRDWLNNELGYLKTARARNKVAHWFKQRDFNSVIETGRQQLEKEVSRLGLHPAWETIAKQFNLKDEEALFASIGSGNLKVNQVLQYFRQQKETKEDITNKTIVTTKPASENQFTIAGVSDLLTRFARCCKPVPNESIVGYITQGRGISIHKKDCPNISRIDGNHKLIAVDWQHANASLFITDIKVIAQDQRSIINDVTALLASEEIILLSLRSTFSKDHNRIYITLTLQIRNIEKLQHLLFRIKQLPAVLEVNRIIS